MPHWAPPYSRNASCTVVNRASLENPSIVVTFDPCAWSTGTRQLFTSVPSIITEHAPHSPSPQPSFVPVNPSSCRSTSSNLSIGYARTVFKSPFTVKVMSRFALPFVVIALRLVKESVCRAPPQRSSHQRCLRALAESYRRGHPTLLPRHSQSLAPDHPSAIHRCPLRHKRRDRCPVPRRTRVSAAHPQKLA